MAPVFVKRLLPLFAQVYTGTLVYSIRWGFTVHPLNILYYTLDTLLYCILYTTLLYAIYSTTLHSILYTLYRKASLTLIRKMIHYISAESLQEMCSRDTDTSSRQFLSDLVEVLASVLDTEVSLLYYVILSYIVLYHL